VTREQVLAQLTGVEADRLTLLAQLIALEVARALHAPDDRLLTVQEAASILGVSVDWLYRHADDFTFTIRPGPGQVRFSSLGIQDYLRKQRR
jgi:predicted DNA-binding transcriptional regulator AlpA